MGHAVQTVPTGAWDYLGEGRVVRLSEKVEKVAQVLKNAQSLGGLYECLVSKWNEPERIVKNWNCSDSLHPLSTAQSAEFKGMVQDEREFMMAMDTLSYLPDDILCKVDRAAMAVSLETRIPF